MSKKANSRSIFSRALLRISLAFLPARFSSLLIKMSDFLLLVAEHLILRKNFGVHPKHELIKYQIFFLIYIDKSKTVLDVGCSYGEVAYKVGAVAKKVVGIDINLNALKFAKAKNSRENITYLHQDILCYEPQERFDVCILSNILEHLEDRINLLKKIKELCETLLIRVPAFERDWWVPYRRSVGLEWRSDKTHYIEHTREEIIKELEVAGWSIDEIHAKWGEYYVKCSVK